MVCSLTLDLFNFCFPSWCFLHETCTFRTLFFVDRICLQALQNSFPSLTMKFWSGNCCTRSCNGTFTVLLFPCRLYLPEVDCSDRSLAIDDGTGLSSVSCKSVADAFFPLVLVRHVTETDNLHTQVTQHKNTTNTSNTTHKQSKQSENNQNCETLGLFIFLSAEIWITVMKNDWKC